MTKICKTLAPVTISLSLTAFVMGCKHSSESTARPVHLITLDPGHFHAALVQKSMYDQVDSNVYVYAPDGPELQQHLDRINGYNSSEKNPTTWNEIVYRGADYFEKMLQEHKGNVVVLAGNNKHKLDYIERSVDAKYNVLADKPMVIDAKGFEKLKTSFSSAQRNEVVLYDIMTERFEITNVLQKELASMPEIFGALETGTTELPAIEIESVHYFSKTVSGKPLIRPEWFMDVEQQGEAIADVATHLVDLAQWQFFPGKIIDLNSDVKVDTANHWPTDMSVSQFMKITGKNNFPTFLHKSLKNDSVLQVFANGSIDYRLFNKHIRIIAKWDYQSPEGSGDTHSSVARGTLSSLNIRQGKDQQYKPCLYVQPKKQDAAFAELLTSRIKKLASKYPGLSVRNSAFGLEIVIPDSLRDGHEAHFAMVMKNFLMYLQDKNMPGWEVPNMIAKYYVTTSALSMIKK